MGVCHNGDYWHDCDQHCNDRPKLASKQCDMALSLLPLAGEGGL